MDEGHADTVGEGFHLEAKASQLPVPPDVDDRLDPSVLGELKIRLGQLSAEDVVTAHLEAAPSQGNEVLRFYRIEQGLGEDLVSGSLPAAGLECLAASEGDGTGYCQGDCQGASGKTLRVKFIHEHRLLFSLKGIILRKPGMA